MIVKVQKEQTVADIAARYHTDEAAIRRDNRLAPTLAVWQGMRLVVHGYVEHIVMPHQSVDDVAALYGVSPNAIAHVNAHWQVGDHVKIPI